MAETMTAAAVAVARLEVGGFYSRSLEEVLAAPRSWSDAHPLIAHTDCVIVEPGPEAAIRVTDSTKEVV